MKKQPFKKRKGVTNPDLPLHNVKKIMNKTFPPPFYMIQSSICRENTIALSLKHTPVHVRAHTRTHMHIQTSSKKADPSKKKSYFKTLGFFRPGN